MADLQKILANIEGAKRRAAGRHEKMHEVQAIREGRWDEIGVGLFSDDIPEPMISNFIDVAAQAAAEAIAPLPSFSCQNPHMNTEVARKSADKRTKIANQYVQHSRLGNTNYTVADHINSYGFGAYVVEPDYDAKMPCIYAESALGAYYALNRKGETVWFARSFRRTVDELMWEYGEYFGQLSELKNARQDTVEVIRYYDADADLLIVPQIKTVLNRYENPLKKCRVVVVERPKTGDVPRGSYDDVVWVQMARNLIAQYTLKISHDVANAPTAIPDDVQEFQVGPDALLRSQNPRDIHKVDLSVPNQPFVELQNLGNELRLGARHSEIQDGQTNASIITGKGIEALAAGPDGRLKTIQGRIASALTDVIGMCFELDEILWGNTAKSVMGLHEGAPFELKYTPKKDIAGNYTSSVSYGLTAGLDPNRALVFLLQLQTAGNLSRDTVLRQMPFDVDVTDEMKRIAEQQIQDSILAGIAQLPQAIPAMAMQGGDPVELIMKTTTFLEAIQKGDAINVAAKKAFAPPPPQETAPEQEAAAGGVATPPQDPMAALMGAAGGAPPGPPGQGDQLLQALAGTGPSGQPNLSFSASTRQAV
jgi:hypothetical protein